MKFIDRPVVFSCRNESLLGIISIPKSRTVKSGVLIVVGGPQYRVGSHRQFVLLSRALARNGIACMRFDCGGMGDSEGPMRDFTQIDEDIRAAADIFFSTVPEMKKIVLWGLCDGASAACCYVTSDSRVTGLVLLNPWVRTERTAAVTLLRHYYLRRLFDIKFWRKLFSGAVSLSTASREVFESASAARSKSMDSEKIPVRLRKFGSLPDRMAQSVLLADCKLMVILSEEDFVANEFDQVAKEHPQWSKLIRTADVERIQDADHTVSQDVWRQKVERLTVNWMKGLERPENGQ